MRQRIVRGMIVCGICLIVIILHTGMALAGIGAQPTVSEIEVAPGTEKSGTIAVANSDTTPVAVKVETEDWLKLRTGSAPIELKEWLNIGDTELFLGPSETKNAVYSVKIPPDIKGELIAQIYFSGGSTGSGALNISSRFGVALYVGIEGTEVVDADIKNLRVEQSIVSFTIENLGNVHIRPSGGLLIKNSQGIITGEVTVPYTAVIFNGGSHDYAITVNPKLFTKGENSIEADLTTGKIYDKTKSFGGTISFDNK